MGPAATYLGTATYKSPHQELSVDGARRRQRRITAWQSHQRGTAAVHARCPKACTASVAERTSALRQGCVCRLIPMSRVLQRRDPTALWFGVLDCALQAVMGRCSPRTPDRCRGSGFGSWATRSRLSKDDAQRLAVPIMWFLQDHGVPP